MNTSRGWCCTQENILLKIKEIVLNKARTRKSFRSRKLPSALQEMLWKQNASTWIQWSHNYNRYLHEWIQRPKDLFLNQKETLRSKAIDLFVLHEVFFSHSLPSEDAFSHYTLKHISQVTVENQLHNNLEISKINEALRYHTSRLNFYLVKSQQWIAHSDFVQPGIVRVPKLLK